MCFFKIKVKKIFFHVRKYERTQVESIIESKWQWQYQLLILSLPLDSFFFTNLWWNQLCKLLGWYNSLHFVTITLVSPQNDIWGTSTEIPYGCMMCHYPYLGGASKWLKENTKKNYFGFQSASSKVHFRSTEGRTFYWSIMTVDDSIKCWFANSGMTDQVGGFQNPGVCLQAFPSFLPHPLPALLLAPLFSRSLTLVPRSFHLNRTETLATQANLKRSHG